MASSTSTDWTAEQALSLADALFVDESYMDAVDTYTAAETVLKESEQVSALHFRILSHRSAAYLALKSFSEALGDAIRANDMAVSMDTLSKAALRVGETEMAWRRQGMAALHLGQAQDALKALEAAQQLAILNKRESESIYPTLIAKCHEKFVDVNDADKKPAPPTKFSTQTPPSTSKATTTEPPASVGGKKSASTHSTPKYQYYQSDKIMTISILEPSVRAEDLTVTFQPEHLTVVLRKQGTSHTVIAGHLYATVVPDACQIKIRPEKVLLKLKKENAFEWPELLSKKSAFAGGESSTSTSAKKVAAAPAENNKNDAPDSQPLPDNSTNGNNGSNQSKSKLARPYASEKDWDAVEKEIVAEEAKEKPEGDAAMNKLFQQIYANADEDTRRAMIKSYQTSGGTVLSTNWSEVKEKNYEQERTAPKGLEWKNWEGEKLPMKDDD